MNKILVGKLEVIETLSSNLSDLIQNAFNHLSKSKTDDELKKALLKSLDVTIHLAKARGWEISE